MQQNVIYCVIIISFSICKGENVTTTKTNTTTIKNTTAAAVNAVTELPTVPTILASPTTTRRPLLQGLRSPCSCKDGQCGCCTGMLFDQFKQKACMNLTYNPDDFEITAQMTMNQRVLYKNSFSGKNPPPMCMRVPRFRFVEFCVEFSNIYFVKRNIHLCIDAEASWEDFTLMEWSFDCLRLGANGVAVVRPEDGGGVAITSIDAEEQTDEDYDDNARNIPLASKYGSVDKTVHVCTKNGTRKTAVHVVSRKDGDVWISFDDELSSD